MDEMNPKVSSPRTLLKIAVILGFLVLLAAIAIPNLVSTGISPHASSYNSCINNLRQIDAAKQWWALENNVTNLETVVTWENVTPYLGRGATGSLNYIYCPDDKSRKCTNSYALGKLGSPPRCRIKPTKHFIN